MLGNTGLSGPEQQQLRELYSFGLAKETWSSYRTAERMLLRCCREKNQKLELPLREETILVFIHWLAFNRNVKAATINTYLSGIRQLHVEKGASTDGLRTEKVNMVLKGLLNKNNVEKRRGRVGSRLPITKDILELLKQRISESDFCGRDQRMVWTVCTVLFHGAFRIHELLCRRKEVFDPDFTLLDGDIRPVEGVEGRSLQVAVGGLWAAPFFPLLDVQQRAANVKDTPPGDRILFAMAAIMRTAAKPTACTNLNGLKRQMDKIMKDQEAAAPSAPSIYWPVAREPAGEKGRKLT